MEFTDDDTPPGMILRDIVAKRIELDLSGEALPNPDQITPLWSTDNMLDTLERHPAWLGTDMSSATRDKLTEVLHDAAQKQALTLLSLPELPADEWLQFGVRAACLSVILAHEFNYPVRDMTAVASASLIHFVSKTLFQSFATEESSVNDFEKVLAREHPTFTGLIVRGSDPNSDLEHQILLQQEERYSGRGYPQGLRGSDQPPRPQRRDGVSTMLPHSEIVNVSIAFERLHLDPITNLSISLLECVEELVIGTEQLYNAFATETLCLLLQRFPVGSRVKVRGNSSGKYLGFSGIVRKAMEDGEKPVVKEIYVTHDPQGQDIDPVHADFNQESHMSLLWS